MHDFLVDMLQCPACGGNLAWRIGKREGERLIEGEATCAACAASYPLRDEIAAFLTPDLQRDDLWAEIDSALAQHLGEHPEIEHELMEAPVERLNPTDLYYRSHLLDERGEFDLAHETELLANQGLYTPEHRAAWEAQYNLVLQKASSGQGPIVDLASGRCYLVERLATLGRPIVATDFAPSVLRRDQRYLQHLGLYDNVSLLAFDARRTPFRDKAVPTLTTNLGLANIENPAGLLAELRRVVSGRFLAINGFYAPDDEPNVVLLKQYGMERMLMQASAEAAFEEAGWHVHARGEVQAPARPTPTSALIEGARVDALPVCETMITWCTLVAS